MGIGFAQKKEGKIMNISLEKQAISAFPHPVETSGIDFIEFAAPDPRALEDFFKKAGFAEYGRHRSKDMVVYQQNDIFFVINAEPDSFAQSYARIHGPSVCGIGYRVKDAAAAYTHMIDNGAQPYEFSVGTMELRLPVIKSIGDTLIYLVDRFGDRTIYDVDFEKTNAPAAIMKAGFKSIDHISHAIHPHRMENWQEFYKTLFNFRHVGTPIQHRAHNQFLRTSFMATSKDDIRIELKEVDNQKANLEEYLQAYNAEAIQKISFASDDIFTTVTAIEKSGIDIMKVPASYYHSLDKKIPNLSEDISKLQKHNILVATDQKGNVTSLRFFMTTIIGKIFFGVVERRQRQAFGQSNFQDLYQAIQRDQTS